MNNNNNNNKHNDNNINNSNNNSEYNNSNNNNNNNSNNRPEKDNFLTLTQVTLIVNLTCTPNIFQPVSTSVDKGRKG